MHANGSLQETGTGNSYFSHISMNKPLHSIGIYILNFYCVFF